MDIYIDDKLAANLVSKASCDPRRSRRGRIGQVFERPVQVAEVPGIALLISAEQNLGNLIVRTNVEGAQIYLDDAEFRAASSVGENFIGNLRVHHSRPAARPTAAWRNRRAVVRPKSRGGPSASTR